MDTKNSHCFVGHNNFIGSTGRMAKIPYSNNLESPVFRRSSKQLPVMEKVKSKKYIAEHGKGEFSLNRDLLRFSYVSPSILLIDRDNMAYYVNKEFFKKQIDKVTKVFNKNLSSTFYTEATRLRKDHKNNNTYKRVRDLLWELFIKFDLDNKKDVDALKNYIFYHFIQTVTNEHEALYAAYIVFTDWDDKIGIEMFNNIYALHTLNLDMFNAECPTAH